MKKKIFRFLILMIAGLLGPLKFALAGPVTFQNDLAFYGDEEGFNGPYRPEETLFGQQLKSSIEALTGEHTGFDAGVFMDHPSGWDDSVDFKPILSFDYFTPTTRMIFGTLETRDRHGFLEPLEVKTLEITRPVEYGLQWEEKDGWFQSDSFLDWQQLNTPGNPEIFDYGGTSQFPLTGGLDAELQFHGYHQGGKLFYVGVVNNYAFALGARLHGDLGPLGPASLSAYGLLSGNLQGPFLQVTDAEWGSGLYVRGSVSPWNIVELYGILWKGWNFFSWEGDANYNSQGLDPGFYQSNRTYGEMGLRKVIAGQGDASLEAEAWASKIDSLWDFSGRLLARISFGLEVPLKERGNSSGN
jgi:hypothetical protein